MDDRTAINRRRERLLLGTAAVLVAVPLLVVGTALALVLGGGAAGVAVAVLVALAVAAGATAAARAGAAPAALAATGAHPATPDDQPRLHNLVDGLCVGMGTPRPGLAVLDDPAPAALALGRSADAAVVVVTTGLVEALTRVEMEAVLAHELSRIRAGDVVPGTLAVPVLGGRPALRVPTPPSPAWAGADDQPVRPSTGPARLALPVLLVAPLARAVVARVGPPPEASLADRAAVEVTRFPPALVAALEKLRADGRDVAAASPAVAHLWLVPPDGVPDPATARVFDPPPPLDERIATLLEL